MSAGSPVVANRMQIGGQLSLGRPCQDLDVGLAHTESRLARQLLSRLTFLIVLVFLEACLTTRACPVEGRLPHARRVPATHTIWVCALVQMRMALGQSPPPPSEPTFSLACDRLRFSGSSSGSARGCQGAIDTHRSPVFGVSREAPFGLSLSRRPPCMSRRP